MSQLSDRWLLIASERDEYAAEVVGGAIRGAGGDVVHVEPGTDLDRLRGQVALVGEQATSAAGVPAPELREDGFVLRVQDERPNVLATGGGMRGTIYAAQELASRAAQGDELPPCELREEHSLPYRWFWTWDHSTNWWEQAPGKQYIGALNDYTKPPEAFLEDYKRVIDFMCLHRLNALTVWGFLRDSHGGVEAAQELAQYAARRGVCLQPGVGINAYGGIYWHGDHEFCLHSWLARHPELAAQPPGEGFGLMACPSKPENLQWHIDGVRWLVETFDIGGIAFETGDYGVCQCAECAKRGERSGVMSHEDMHSLYEPLLSAAWDIKPDLWIICETYQGFHEKIIQNPPYADRAIWQWWSYEADWPDQYRALKEGVDLTTRLNVSRTHAGTQWAAQRFAPRMEHFAQQALIARSAGLSGVSMFGEEPASTVPNELNYLTFSHFAYSDDDDLERFIDEDLGALLGGASHIRKWLSILSEVGPPRSPNVPLETLPALDEPLARRYLIQAQQMAGTLSGEPARRWQWTADYLEGRLAEEKTRGPE